MNDLVEVLLLGPSTLSRGERELIATYVSARNDCTYCQSIHGAIAAHHLGGNEELVQCVKLDLEHAESSEKMKALFAIAGKVQLGGKHVTSEDIERARGLGATDLEIHDLATWTPEDPDFYRSAQRSLSPTVMSRPR